MKLKAEYIVSLLRSGRTQDATAWVLSHGVPIRHDSQGRIDIEGMLEACGIELRDGPLGAAGMIARRRDGWEIVRAASDVPTQRLTAAHELGHWLLEVRYGLDAQAVSDLGLPEVVEEFCEVFASTLLVSPFSLDQILPRERRITFDSLRHLARRYAVPIRAVLQSIKASTWPQGGRQFVVVVKPSRSSGRLQVLEPCTSLNIVPKVERPIVPATIGLREIEKSWVGLKSSQEVLHVERISSEIVLDLSVDTFEVSYRCFHAGAEGVFIVGLGWGL